MEISKYNKAMQFLLKPKYLTKDFIIQAASDAQPETREGFAEGTKLTDYIKTNISGSTGLSTPGKEVKVNNEIFNAIVNLKIPYNDKLKLLGELGYGSNRTTVDLSQLGKKYGIDLGTETYKDKYSNYKVGGEYTTDGGTRLRAMIDPENKSANFSVVSEFADGGIVEREGFANGKKLKPYGMTSYEMDQARIDNLNFEIEKRNKLGVKTIAPQLEKSTGYERSNINKLIQTGRVTRLLSKEELVTQYINKAIEENKTIGEMTKKAIGDYISADLPKGSKGRLENHTTAKIIKKQFPELFKTLYTKNSGALDQLARNTDLLDIPINDFIKDPTKIRRERSNNTNRRGQNNARLRILQGKLKLGPRDFAVSEAQDDFIVNINNAIKKDNNLVLKNPKLMELVSTTFDNTPGSPTYGQIISKARNEEKIKADIKKGFFSNEHLTPKALEKMNTEFPTNKLLIPRSTNSNLIKSSQNYLKNNRNDKNAIQALEGLTNKFNININTESGKIGPKQGSTVEGNKLLSYENQLKTMGFNSPDVNFNIVKDITKEELQKTKSSMKEQVNRFKELLNPQEQALVKKFGNQVNSGVPIDEIINALPAKEAQILKAMGSKIGNIAKLGVRGVAELTVGLGPLGAGITALITAPLALYDLSEGDRGSEVIQNTASDLTFGLTPRADERIIREIGGESAVRGFGIQQKIDEYKSAKENLKNLNEQLNNPSSTLFSEDQDSLLASIERNKNIIKENETFLQTLVNDQGKLISPDYTNYLKAADRQKLEKEITKQTRLERYNIDGGSDETQTEFNSPQLEQLKNLKGSLEKTYVGNQDKPKPYPSLMQGTVGEPIDNILNRNYAYAVGGRVGFEKGGKPPKDNPIIPINPMIDEGPQDPGKRTFLKGVGAVGLGAVALGTGLLKLGKSAVSSKIGSMVKNTTAPSWMEALIAKVIKEGTDIPIPKQPGSAAEKISIKELEFKNPETGQMEKVQLKIDETKDSVTVDYYGNNTVANQGVTLELVPKQKIVDKGEHLTSEPIKGQYEFRAIESEPRVVNWDGDIEFDSENYVHKIIDLNSDISGLKSYATGGKGINKKIAKEKRIATEKIQDNPTDYLDDTYDYNSIDTSYYND
jgi:hypothetical protein